MNVKIEKIEAAETQIEELRKREEAFRKEAMKDGVIDTDEQAVLDRIKGKIAQLRGVVRKVRETIEENKRIWESKAADYVSWQDQIKALKDWGHISHATFDRSATDIGAAVADQRWADATSAIEASVQAMTPVYQTYQTQSAAKQEYDAGLLALKAKIVEFAGAPGESDDVAARKAEMATLRTEMVAAAGKGDGVTAKAKLAEFEAVLQKFGAAKKVAAAVPAMADAGGESPAPADAADAAAAKAAAAKAAEEEKWKAAFEAFKAHLALLEKHAKAGANPEIKPKIDAIKSERDKAVTKATADDFKGALAQITPLSKKCDETEDLANAFAHYSAILSHRKGLVTPNIGVNTGVADVDKLQRQIEVLLTKAQADATAGKFADGFKKLDQIPPLHQKMKVTDSKETDYTSQIANHDPRFTAIDALAANVRAPFQKQIDALKKTYSDGKYAKTKDYVVSMQIIGSMWGDLGFIERMTKAAKTYLAVFATFETQYKALEAHKGRAGIEEFFLGMKGDYEKAKTEAAAGKHSTATALLNRTKPRWAAQKQIADDCLAYSIKRTAVAKVIEDVRKNPAAATVLQQADGLMAAAAGQALTKDYKSTLASVLEAERRAAQAKAAAEAEDQLGKLKDEGALGKIDANFDAAYKVFTDMKANVVSKDAGSDFTMLIATTDGPAQKAKDEKAKDTPDFTAARGHLDTAIAILEGALPKILANGPFQTHLTAAKALVDGALPPLSLDDCIKAAITAAKKLVTEAEALAKAAGYDFAGGEAKLVEATKIGEAARVNAALWPAIKTDKTATKAAVDAIAAEATVVPLMTARTTRLAKILADIDTLVAANDFKGAAAKGKEGAGLGAPTTADIKKCKKLLKYKTDKVDAKLPSIQGAGKDAAAPELVIAIQKLADSQAMLNDGNFDGAYNILREARWAINRGTKLIAAIATYEPARVAAETKLKAATLIRNAAIEVALVALEARYKAAVAEAANGNHFGAERDVKVIADACDPLIVLATTFKAYDDARKIADPKLKEAESHKQAAAIQTILVRLRGKYDNAVALATGGGHAGAQKMMEEIVPAAEEALKSADGSATFAGIAEYIADSASDDGPSIIHMAAAKTAYAWQAGKDNAAVAKADLDETKSKLATAGDSATAPSDAKVALQAAMDAITRASQIISQHQLLTESVEAAKAKIAELNAHARKVYIAALITGLETAVDAVVNLASDGSKLDKASADLEAAMSGYHDAKAKADAQAKYLALRAQPDVEARLDKLERHAHSYAIQPNIDAIRKKLAAAAEKSKAMDPEAAIVLLEEVKALGISSLVLADMRANSPPKVADVKAILARPDGQAELDAMLDELEPDARRKVLRVAFEARFGCDLKNFSNAAKNPDGSYKNPILDGALEGPNIKRFYEIMSDLPPEHTVGNDSMRSFTMIESGGGSVYSGSRKDVVMREGDATTSTAYSFGQESQVGEVEDKYKPANEDPVKFFSWNTLHEVGHAVDDKQNFMNKNGSSPTYGGWTEYGRNLKPIADILEGKFKYDATYIGQAMAGNANPAIPAIPAGETCSEEVWESRRVAFRAWLTSASEPNSPWASNSVAQRIAIDGVVYQESYKTRWFSYLLAARSRGITGYQFRAPGEWFSEMYAAFHSGKLKKTNPAAKWLADL